MICYRDKTFCTFYKECKNGNDCSRALTDEVQSNADSWWYGIKGKNNDGPPICQFSEKPECFQK